MTTDNRSQASAKTGDSRWGEKLTGAVFIATVFFILAFLAQSIH
jgi:hypothetical protein